MDYAPLTTPELRLDRPRLEALLDQADPGKANLFAYPAQSNFSGVRHPLELVAQARSKGWDVLLDAAALAPTRASGSQRGAAGLREPVVLQDVRLPDGRGGAADSPRGVRETAAPVVCRRDGELRFGAGQRARFIAERGRLRGRHAELSGDSRRGDRAALSRVDRRRDDRRARALPDRLAAGGAFGAAPRQWPGHGAHLRTDLRRRRAARRWR